MHTCGSCGGSRGLQQHLRRALRCRRHLGAAGGWLDPAGGPVAVRLWPALLPSRLSALLKPAWSVPRPAFSVLPMSGPRAPAEGGLGGVAAPLDVERSRPAHRQTPKSLP